MWTIILGLLKGPILSGLKALWGWLQIVVSAPAWLLAGLLLFGLVWEED